MDPFRYLGVVSRGNDVNQLLIANVTDGRTPVQGAVATGTDKEGLIKAKRSCLANTFLIGIDECLSVDPYCSSHHSPVTTKVRSYLCDTSAYPYLASRPLCSSSGEQTMRSCNAVISERPTPLGTVLCDTVHPVFLPLDPHLCSPKGKINVGDNASVFHLCR